MAFHAPTCKLIATSYARLLYNDCLLDAPAPELADVPTDLRRMPYEQSISDRVVEKTFMALTKKQFQERVQPSLEVPTMYGNEYAASVYSGLASLIANISSKDLQGKKIGIFSYGGGLASSLFSIKVIGSTEEMAKNLNIKERLAARTTVSPKVYKEVCISYRIGSDKTGTNMEKICNLRKNAHLQKSYIPIGNTETISKGTYYLTHIDDVFCRKYEIKA